jgi:hypothetical protein
MNGGPQVASREELLLSNMIAIQEQIPKNDFGMPEFIVRADMIPHHLESMTRELQWAHIDAARVDIHYSDGFPVTNSGSLFWERLDHEGSSEFMLFQRYLEMVSTYGYRSTQLLAKSLVRESIEERVRLVAAEREQVREREREQVRDRDDAQSAMHVDAATGAATATGVHTDVDHIAVPTRPNGSGGEYDVGNIFIDMVSKPQNQKRGSGSGIKQKRPPMPSVAHLEKGSGHSRTQAHEDEAAALSTAKGGLPAIISDVEHEQLMRATNDRLRTLFILYFWKARASAFDIVGEAAVRKIRAVRAIHLDERTFTRVNKMVERVMSRFDHFSADDLDSLDPGETVKVLKELLHLQRVSVGLPAAAPADAHLPGSSDSNASTPIEEHLRTIANTRDRGEVTGLEALDDEDTANLAQELAVRLLKGKKQ